MYGYFVRLPSPDSCKETNIFDDNNEHTLMIHTYDSLIVVVLHNLRKNWVAYHTDKI